MRGVDDEVGGRLHPRPGLLVVADVVETPLARDGQGFVGLDPFVQNVGVHVQQHVEDVKLGSLEASDEFLPVLLAQDRLHGDQMLAGEKCDLLGEDGDQLPPRREVLEVPELMVLQCPHQQVTDLFWIEEPGIGKPSGQLHAGRGLARAERSVEPDDHPYILSAQTPAEH